MLLLISLLLSGCAGVSGNLEVTRPEGNIGLSSDGRNATVYGQHGIFKGSTTFKLPDPKGLAK